MSTLSGTVLGNGNIWVVNKKIKKLLTKYPQWWVWLLSLMGWSWLFFQAIAVDNNERFPGGAIYCIPPGTTLPLNEIHEIAVGTFTTNIWNVVSNGLLPWLIMVIAMMYPLLDEPINHVAVSVKRKDKNWAIFDFLIGYLFVWGIIGLLFLLLPVLVNVLFENQTWIVSALIKMSGFCLCAILVWHPARGIKMIKCSQTIPIGIQSWRLHLDSLTYGMRMGVICLNICWVPMVALMLAHHNLILMYLTTGILIFERYLLPHSSKFPGYAWASLAILVLCIEIAA
jgi:predicted metal-binding membrane protein